MKRTMIRHMFLAFFLLPMFVIHNSIVAADEKTLFEKNSLYQYIKVIEIPDKKERHIINMKRDYNQGGIYIDRPDTLLFEYTQMAFISLAYLDRAPADVLFVGLGAGSMPRYFNRYYPDVSVDIVEIDPDIFEVAKTYFHFKETPTMKVHIADGRIYIKRTKKKYDMIFLDAYQNDYIPFHLTTKEFLKEIKRCLKKGGVVISNITSPFKNKFFDSMIETYNEVYPHLYIFKGRKSNNYIFIATEGNRKREREDVERHALKVQQAKKFDFDYARMGWAYGYSSDYRWGEAQALTDDFAPVNLYKHMKSRK